MNSITMAKHLNVEIKARCYDLNRARSILLANGADFKGTDFQTDTYFACSHGRLKLRQGNIENALIFYARENTAAPKGAKVNMLKVQPGDELLHLLEEALGVLVTVTKKREIYFIGNVKFHLDEVTPLGVFLEIEAIDMEGDLGEDRLRAQCNQFLELLGIQPDQLLTHSYSDMLMQLGQ